jgi:hypothetical protein
LKEIEAWKVLTLCHMTSEFVREAISFTMMILMRHSLTSQFVVPVLCHIWTQRIDWRITSDTRWRAISRSEQIGKTWMV